jgi:hypothetical protein
MPDRVAKKKASSAPSRTNRRPAARRETVPEDDEDIPRSGTEDVPGTSKHDIPPGAGSAADEMETGVAGVVNNMMQAVSRSRQHDCPKRIPSSSYINTARCTLTPDILF